MDVIEPRLSFTKNKENDDYLMMKVRPQLGYFLSSQKLPSEIFEELKIMNGNLSTYEKENNIPYYDGEVALRKDSIIGIWLEENQHRLITNKDSIITIENIENALLIAFYDGYEKMINKIGNMFHRKEIGTKEELLTDRNEKVLDYILSNTDINKHLKEVEETEGQEILEEPTEYLVYEDGTYIRKTLVEQPKILVR